MDPQQHAVLSVGYAAMSARGRVRSSLANEDVGTTLGMMNTDHARSVGRIPGPYDMTGNGAASAGARLSFTFALRGPCVAMDTACSSSLVATHVACRLIEHDECDDALSVGTNLILTWTGAFATFAVAGMLSTGGRCHTFDARADGYQRGEGTVALWNTSEAATLTHVGSSILHNGQSATFTALNGSSQQHLLRRASTSGSNSHVEAHGTGTALGDPVEVGALAATLDEISVASLKGNNGHAEGAAGAGGLANLAAVLFEGVSVCNMQLRRLNHTVSDVLSRRRLGLSVASTPTRSNDVAGGASSFGATGIIAHGMLHCKRREGAAEAALSAPSLYRLEADAKIAEVRVLLRSAVPPPPGSDTVASVVRVRGAMEDHLISGVVLFPGVGYVEMAASDSRSLVSSIEGLSFVRPCELALDTELRYSCSADGAFEIASRAGTHAHGRLGTITRSSVPGTARFGLFGSSIASPARTTGRTAATPATGRIQLWSRSRASSLRLRPRVADVTDLRRSVSVALARTRPSVQNDGISRRIRDAMFRLHRVPLVEALSRSTVPSVPSAPRLARVRRAVVSEARPKVESTRQAAPRIVAGVEELISEVLYDLQSTTIASESPLADAGLDSIAATEFANSLVSRLETELSSTLLYDHPTITSIASLVASTSPSECRAVEERPAEEPRLCPSLGQQPSARPSIGPVRSLLLPGAHSSTSALKQLAALALAANSTALVARSRGTQAVGSYGAFASTIKSNAGAFSISAAEARVMDPQSGLVLEGAYATLNSPREALRTAPIGFFLGIAGSSLLAPSGGEAETSASFSVYGGTAYALSVASGRVSYALGLTGPCASLDTACSSSLVAAHAAVSALRLGECPRAVATGVGLLSASATAAFSAAGMLSALGRCHTLDRRADGYCRGEGCGSFQVTTGAGSARVDGIAVQQDGPSASLTAPNGTSQQRLLVAISWASARAVALEAHGTGTALGDPIEIGAAARALRATGGTARCSSLKSNAGHLEAAAAAAGLAALVTVSTSIDPPNAQLRRLNAHVGSLVSGEDSRAELPIEATGRRASAGRLSSFGFSGTIAHGLYVPGTVARDLVGALTAQSLFRRASQIARAGVYQTFGGASAVTAAPAQKALRGAAYAYSQPARVYRPLLASLYFRSASMGLATSPSMATPVVLSLAKTRTRPRAKTVSRMRLAFFHGMDTYAEFQVGSLAYQVWTTAPFDWVTASAPHRGADFSTGAGGGFLRKKFGYEPRKSRSWRLLTQYSLNSSSQASMFARIREATDQKEDTYGTSDGWSASVASVRRFANEQAPLEGFAGISEGATVGAVLLAEHLRGIMDFGAGFEGRSLVGVCALTSPAHARMYEDSIAASTLQLVGSADTLDVQHMGGRTAAMFGHGASVVSFSGGHKLPRLAPRLRDSFVYLTSSVSRTRMRTSTIMASVCRSQRPRASSTLVPRREAATARPVDCRYWPRPRSSRAEWASQQALCLFDASVDDVRFIHSISAARALILRGGDLKDASDATLPILAIL